MRAILVSSVLILIAVAVISIVKISTVLPSTAKSNAPAGPLNPFRTASATASTIPLFEGSSAERGSSADSTSSTSYVSSTLGFNIRYPISFPPDQIPSLSTVSFTVISSASGSRASLNVDAAPDISDASIDTCLVAPESSETATFDVASTTINGVEFLTFARSSASAGYEWYARYYKTIHNNQCFAIVEQISGATDAIAADKAHAFTTFDGIVHSLHFMH